MNQEALLSLGSAAIETCAIPTDEDVPMVIAGRDPLSDLAEFALYRGQLAFVVVTCCTVLLLVRLWFRAKSLSTAVWIAFGAAAAPAILAILIKLGVLSSFRPVLRVFAQ